MPLNLDAIGKDVEPYTFNYDWKKVVLYALGVGAGFDELDYCYEKISTRGILAGFVRCSVVKLGGRKGAKNAIII